jgi:hypothetical protein
MHHVEVEDTAYLAGREHEVLPVKVGVKPCAGKLVDQADRKVVNQVILPAAEIVQLWPDIRGGKQGVQAAEFLIAVRPPPAQLRNRVVQHRHRREVDGRGVDVGQAARRAPELRPAVVAVRVSWDEAEQDPRECPIQRDAAVAGLRRDDLGRGDAAAAEMLLEVELEEDPIPAGIAPAAAEYIPRAVGVLHEHVHVPGAAGQRSGEPGSRQRPPVQHRRRLTGRDPHGAA